MPFTLETHDRVLSYEYRYRGPRMDVPFLPWVIRFRDRTLPEWVLLGLLAPFVWPFIDLVMSLVSVTPMAKGAFDGPVWALVHVFVAWYVASWASSGLCKVMIDADRSAGYLLNAALTEAMRWLRSRGPYDPAVFFGGIIPWIAFNRLFVATLPLPRVFTMLAAVFAARWLTRRVRNAIESPTRTRRRVLEQAKRRPLVVRVAGAGS